MIESKNYYRAFKLVPEDGKKTKVANAQ
jgi:hypothetical protein